MKFEQQVNFSERYDICYKMAELLKIETSSNGKDASELFDIHVYEFFHDICYFDIEFQIFLFIAYQINTIGATSGVGTAYPSWAPEFTHGF